MSRAPNNQAFWRSSGTLYLDAIFSSSSGESKHCTSPSTPVSAGFDTRKSVWTASLSAGQRSSASMNASSSPQLAAIPALRAAAGPAFAVLTTFARAATPTFAVWSVDPSSTTTTSVGPTVCARTLANVSLKVAAACQAAQITLIEGIKEQPQQRFRKDWGPSGHCPRPADGPLTGQ